ncbi:MAG: C4-dicarboxylate ABC transporter substrate-binding protein [Desulfobacteraceae bacterium]|nr:MAG: C4-dicarboxylate ABC transporter substrate-binding protein [Desulfobacteraceae bacterium]
MKKVFVFSAFGMLIAFFGFCVSPLAAQQSIKINFASSLFGPTHGISKMHEEFIGELEKRTSGGIKVTYHPAGTFIAPPQMYDSIVKGIIDVGESACGYTRGRFPLTEVFDFPLGFGDAGTAVNLTRIQNAYYEKFRPKEFEDVKLLLLFGQQSQILHTKKPVRTLEEYKGLRIRAAGTAAQVPPLFGAVAISVPATETYDVLRKGAADGILIPPEALKGYRLGEVVKYTTRNYSSCGGASFFLAMSKKKWESLPPDIQKTIEEVSKEFHVKYGQRWDDIDREGMEFAKSLGNEIITLSPEEDKRWAALARPLVDDYVKRMKEKDLPGDKVVEFIETFKQRK